MNVDWSKPSINHPSFRRFHVVQEFNRGVYDYIIASDESAGPVEADDAPIETASDDEDDGAATDEEKDGTRALPS